ncbi:hypothetical protein AC579_7754 [Pseudocercospora musae]|uniref:Uncharacterized protein n=1 Tax=Pseudocercospora musae TaxID=113226 RepID=A0A139IJY2_9PEZI|nr:hypothetical protein AC579_7754 [Pseudocercospora musae]
MLLYSQNGPASSDGKFEQEYAGAELGSLMKAVSSELLSHSGCVSLASLLPLDYQSLSSNIIPAFDLLALTYNQMNVFMSSIDHVNGFMSSIDHVNGFMSSIDHVIA